MRVTPKTQQQLDDERFGPGTYDFEVIEAEETTSAAGNDMIKLRLRIFNAAGQSITLTDYLLDAMAHKLRHAAEGMGLLDRYNRGDFPADALKGRTGRVICVPDKRNPDYLAVKDYEKGRQHVVSPISEPPIRRQAAPVSRAPIDDSDEIPF